MHVYVAAVSDESNPARGDLPPYVEMRHRESPPRDPRFSVPSPLPPRELRRHIFLTSSSGNFAPVQTIPQLQYCYSWSIPRDAIHTIHVMYMYDVVCGTADQSDEPCAFLGKRFVFSNQREPLLGTAPRKSDGAGG